MSDNVEHPSHYNTGSVETIDAIKSALGDAFLDYCLGNVLKYVWRCKHKGKLLEDLRKAAKYLEWAIAEAEGEKPSEPQPLAIPDGWRELNQGESLSIHDLFDFEGEWTACKYDPIGDRYNNRIHKRHIRKIEADKPEHVEGVWVEEADANASKIQPTEWIPKVGDKVRLRVPVLYPTRDSRNYEGRITEISQSGRFTIFFASEDQRIRGWVKPKDLQLIEAAS